MTMNFLAIFLLFSASFGFAGGAVAPSPTVDTVECDTETLTQCTVTCGGGWQVMKYVCVDKTTKDCKCPTNPIYYQCNNRPCLGKNATLIDIFYDQEDQQAAENEVEYVQDDSSAGK